MFGSPCVVLNLTHGMAYGVLGKEYIHRFLDEAPTPTRSRQGIHPLWTQDMCEKDRRKALDKKSVRSDTRAWRQLEFSKSQAVVSFLVSQTRGCAEVPIRHAQILICVRRACDHSAKSQCIVWKAPAACRHGHSRGGGQLMRLSCGPV